MGSISVAILQATEQAKIHRCPKCGETDLSQFAADKRTPSGLRCYCRACGRTYDKESTRKRKATMEGVCTYCEQTFSMTRKSWQQRVKKNPDRMYCSGTCSNLDKREEPRGNLLLFKRRSSWSDERWYWERKLVELGLGEHVGISQFVEYGHNNYWVQDVVKHRKNRGS